MSLLAAIRDQAAQSLRENIRPIALIVIYIGACMWASAHFGFELRMKPVFSLWLFGIFYFLIAAAGILWLFVTERPDSPLRLLADLPRRWRLGERFIMGVPLLVAAAVFLPVFSSMKSAIPVMADYTWDPLFARMDEWIHGRPAWELLQPVIGYPIVSFILNVLYHLWLPAFYATLCAVAVWVEQPVLRRRFLIAFILCWALVGNLAAVLLASVGPCFYDYFYGEDRFAGLMNYLHAADKIYPLAALRVQDTLLVWWKEGSPELGRGISAMPSVHVSIACLLMLLSWRIGRRTAWIGTAFLVSILLGSIHLAYHYAVDGYASLVITFVIWQLAGPLATMSLPSLRKRPAAEASPS